MWGSFGVGFGDVDSTVEVAYFSRVVETENGTYPIAGGRAYDPHIVCGRVTGIDNISIRVVGHPEHNVGSEGKRRFGGAV